MPVALLLALDNAGVVNGDVVAFPAEDEQTDGPARVTSAASPGVAEDSGDLVSAVPVEHELQPAAGVTGTPAFVTERVARGPPAAPWYAGNSGISP
jgi:hypothetical protein